MKKLLVFITIALLTFSCSDDDNNEENTQMKTNILRVEHPDTVQLNVGFDLKVVYDAPSPCWEFIRIETLLVQLRQDQIAAWVSKSTDDCVNEYHIDSATINYTLLSPGDMVLRLYNENDENLSTTITVIP